MSQGWKLKQFKDGTIPLPGSPMEAAGTFASGAGDLVASGVIPSSAASGALRLEDLTVELGTLPAAADSFALDVLNKGQKVYGAAGLIYATRAPVTTLLLSRDGGTTWVDYTVNVTDAGALVVDVGGGVAGQVLVALGFRGGLPVGFRLDLLALNDIAAVMAAKYWDGTALQALTITADGTDVAGDSMKVDGDVTFTPPSDLTLRKLSAAPAAGGDVAVIEDFFVQLEWGAALTAPTTITEAFAIRGADIPYRFATPAIVKGTDLVPKPAQPTVFQPGTDLRIAVNEVDATAADARITPNWTNAAKIGRFTADQA